MENRTLFFMTMLVLAAIGVMLAINFAPIFFPPQSEKYLSYNKVRGMAIEHDNLFYTLNFEQQNEMINLLNSSIPVGKKTLGQEEEKSLNFQKLVIYRFDEEDLLLTPLAYVKDDLMFSVPGWNKEGWMKDTSEGTLKALIGKTFDP